MREHHLQVARTARFFTTGELNDSTTRIWIVIHGYAQLASDFLIPFKGLGEAGHFVVAPEGLSRFYAKGFGGKPAASWMTSEDRLNEIEDYIKYLDQVYEELKLGQTRAKIILLGFSQGVATASRWLHASANRVDHFVVYAGEIAKELLSPVSARLQRVPITYITGTNDPLIAREHQVKVSELMKSLGAAIMEFEGGHEVREEVLGKIAV